MPATRTVNTQLATVIAAANLTHGQVAREIVRIAGEAGRPSAQLLGVGRSHVSKWVAGVAPSARAAQVLGEALSRLTGRVVTLGEIGLGAASESSPDMLDWYADTLVALTDLGRVDVDPSRRRVLGATAYSLTALSLPDSAWWEQLAALHRHPADGGRVGVGDVEAVRDMVALFSQVDQRRGGGHARTAVVQYLTSDVAAFLGGRFASDTVRRDMLSAASELAYLSGWMAFDNAEHTIAQQYFKIAVRLAAEADDPALAGHVLRAMAHQAIDLGHRQQALDLAGASVEGDRYARASPRERALLGVVHARALAVNEARDEAAMALLRAENDLRGAGAGDDEPRRVFFFGEASLAHETALTLREMNDLNGAVLQFRRSVAKRKAAFARTHAVTLGYLGATQVKQGSIEAACATWSKSLDAMQGVRSGRTRQVAADMRALLSPFKQRGLGYVTDIDARAASYLSTWS